MKVVKVVTEAFKFICTVQFWRMAVLWTLSLIFSFLKLFSHTLFLSKSKIYSGSSPQDPKSNAATLRRLPICVITGATSGLGAAAAHALSKEGFYVVLVWNMQADRETVSGTCFLKSRCYPYAQVYEYSKFCLLLFSYELHRQAGRAEKSHHFSVVAVDPGAVKTNIMREIPSCISQMAYIVLNLLGLLHSSETGVRAIVDGALAPPEISGVYFFGGNGCCLKSSALSHNVKLAEELWATSCDLFQELQLAS